MLHVGEKGSSAARLSEAKIRASLYKKLEFVESTIRELLSTIKRRFSDVVTFNGRPYDEKMNWDRQVYKPTVKPHPWHSLSGIG